jgi:hypothetical protein
VTATPVVEHCPNCGAPLELDDQGDCHWCHEHVTMASGLDASGLDVDGLTPDEAKSVEKVDRHDELDLPDGDVYLPLPVFPLLACLNTSAYDLAVQAFLAAPERVDSIRALARAVEAAGHRLQDADVPENDVIQKGEKIYTPDELWTFELLADLLVRLESVNGLERDTRTGLKESVSTHDDMWQSRVKKALKRAGDGPEQFRDLRSAIPHRH